MKVRPKLTEREYQALHGILKEAERLGQTLGVKGPRGRCMARLDDAWAAYATAQAGKARARPLPDLAPLVGGGRAYLGDGLRE